MIDIYNISGAVIDSVPVTEGCEHVAELMSSDYVKLSYRSTSGAELPAGSYIIFNSETYRLLKPYTPTQKDEVEYLYEPEFQSKVMAWSVKPFFFLETDTDGNITSRETDWSLTGTISDFLANIVASLLDELGETFTYSYDSALSGTKTLSFAATDIFSALTEIADEWETEWWVDGTVVTLGKCIHSSQVMLSVGTHIGIPTVTKNSESYFTRFYAFGSARNINQDYTSGSSTNHVIQKRLTLPVATCPNGYKDIREGLTIPEINVSVLMFEDIYPSSNFSISGVRAETKYKYDASGNRIQIGTDELNNPIYDSYSIFYFSISGYTFDLNSIISGESLSVHFTSGNLIGREFELSYNSTTSEFEIIIDESTGYIIPNEVLIPANGDQIILFNIEMPSPYVTAAEEALEAALDAEMGKQSVDYNTYQFNSFPVKFSELNITLKIGSSVSFVNGTNNLSTRVLSLTEKLDCLYEKNIKIGEKKTVKTTQQLKQEVTNINKNIEIIATLNNLSTNLQNAYGSTQKKILEALAQWSNMWYFDKTDDLTQNKTDYASWKVRSSFDLHIDKGIKAVGSISTLTVE